MRAPTQANERDPTNELGIYQISRPQYLLRRRGVLLPAVPRTDVRHHGHASQTRQPREPDRTVLRGKHIWETRNCIGCHTLLGEGAYFAPELGNVYKRRGPEFIKAWIKGQPTGAPGRRQMPNFHLTDQQLDDMVSS